VVEVNIFMTIIYIVVAFFSGVLIGFTSGWLISPSEAEIEHNHYKK